MIVQFKFVIIKTSNSNLIILFYDNWVLMFTQIKCNINSFWPSLIDVEADMYVLGHVIFIHLTKLHVTFSVIS